MLEVLFTANARAMGGRQVDQFKSHAHIEAFSSGTGSSYTAVTFGGQTAAVISQSNIPTSNVGGTETRPVNVAYHPRIHA
ncbi:hypothetical protein ACOTDT_16540 [Achromobacter xylosoxidans]